jgi:hypothetical protein
MKLKRLSDYLSGEDVETGDVVTIIGEPTLRPKEETGFNRDTFSIKVVLPDGDEREWTLNKTTYNALFDAFGDESRDWLNRQVRIRKTQQKVMGSMKDVLYGEPVKEPAEPQQTLPPSPPDKVTLQEAIAKTKNWPTEDRNAYLDYLRSTGRLQE